MRVTIDRVGRLVIPKALRDAVGIGPETELEATSDGAGLRLEPVRRGERPVGESDGLPVLGLVEGLVMTDADVQRTRDDAQR